MIGIFRIKTSIDIQKDSAFRIDSHRWEDIWYYLINKHNELHNCATILEDDVNLL